MEFTKDASFYIKYDQDQNEIKINKKFNKKKDFFSIIKRHKFVTSMCFAGVLLISADVILINNFINVLKHF